MARFTQIVVLSPKRVRILQVLAENPGLGFVELHTALGKPGFGTLAHHLQVLTKFGKVRSIRVRLTRRFYSTEATPAEARRLDAYAKDHRYGTLLRLLAELPGATQAELGARLGVSRSAVAYLETRLTKAGLVTVERRQGRRVVRLATGVA